MSRNHPEPLEAFSALTRDWFTGTFPSPTQAQAQAWAAIVDGRDTLVVAPTGSGKTLAAFLWALDQLAATPHSGPRRGTQVLYVSPLKALAVDVERNLRTPLAGIARMAAQRGLPSPDITVGVRSGDTAPARRRELIANPPDILITTPESLFLMLTSAAHTTLSGIRTVIIDEVHAVAGTKRGAHLALSLERLDALSPGRAQRIGLSATVHPVDEVARFLSGQSPTAIVAPPCARSFQLSVEVPLPDMANPAEGTVWPDVEERIVDLIQAHRTSIVFVNSRRLAERLTSRINEINAQRGGESYDNAAPLARAHHGSVALQTRAEVEDQLKSGCLRAVVATSSLELGIDMGSVDLVIQVEAPPSVASGLQRVGRAGHQVGQMSSGVLIPKHRTDLIGCAVVVHRMLAGQIETLTVPANPLDILAQQTVAAACLGPLDAEVWFDTVRRSAPFATLSRAMFEATLDLLSGKYPSTEFAELRPRLVYDRDSGTLTGRPGAQRLAVTSGGAIADRGLFPVYLAGAAKPSRVGELDEEMVYESRPGDVIALGATSWRITEITHDRVLVAAAPGQLGRLPFWHGDGVGRPAELGIALGKLTGELAALDRDEFDTRCAGLGFDEYARDNLRRLLEDQLAATAAVPTDTTLIVERFRDELGDWRVVLHSPYGLRVHAPLALAVGRRVRDRYGIDENPTASDDGIVVRLPDTDFDSGLAAAAELFVFEADEIESIVTSQVGGSALFASRFRECAARALLLPRRYPGRRTPLWQQRQRSAHLLDVARRYADFPIVLETVRECLRDVYDVPALMTLMNAIAQQRVRMSAVETTSPSAFAASLLFGYVGAFIYEGDSPLAERRAAALSLDPALLAQLLGRVELRELLNPDVIESVNRQLQHLDGDRKARDAEEVADLLRLLGPLTADEVSARTTTGQSGSWLDHLLHTRRVLTVAFAGHQWWVAIEDIGRLRDGLGVAVPPGIPHAFTGGVADPLGELLSRFARTRGPFSTEQAAGRFGLGVRVTADALSKLTVDGRLVRGEFTDLPDTCGQQWCDGEVLRILRRRSLAALRSAIEPVSPTAYGRFLPAWQHIGASDTVSGIDGLACVIDQLAGIALPASAVESLIFRPRVRDYAPALLDELLASGEALWSGAGIPAGSASEGWIRFHTADSTSLTVTPPSTIDLGRPHRHILNVLDGGGAFFFRQLAGDFSDSELKAALWELIWSGWISGDTFSPVRAVLAGTRRSASGSPRTTRPPRLDRYRMQRPATPAADPAIAGRWSALPTPEHDSTIRAHHTAELLLHRYGVLTRGAVMTEGVAGGFASLYKVLTAFEESGRCQRGYFIESLGAAQFARAATVDRLRSYLEDVDPTRPDYQAVVLAAADPANPYGAVLNWPAHPGNARPGRKAGALVVLVDGTLAWFVERGGRSLLNFTDAAAAQHAAAAALARTVRERNLDGLLIERVDGTSALEPGLSVTLEALIQAGFARTPRGLRLR